MLYEKFKTKLDSVSKIQVPKINVQHQIHYNQKLKRLQKVSQEQLIQTTTKFWHKTHSKI